MRKQRTDTDNASYLPTLTEIDRLKREIRAENEARQRDDAEDEDEEDSVSETIRAWKRA